MKNASKRGGRPVGDKFLGANVKLSTMVDGKRVVSTECESDLKGITSFIAANLKKHGKGNFSITVEKVVTLPEA
jgi:hypothetical protein